MEVPGCGKGCINSVTSKLTGQYLESSGIPLEGNDCTEHGQTEATMLHRDPMLRSEWRCHSHSLWRPVGLPSSVLAEDAFMLIKNKLAVRPLCNLALFFIIIYSLKFFSSFYLDILLVSLGGREFHLLIHFQVAGNG